MTQRWDRLFEFVAAVYESPLEALPQDTAGRTVLEEWEHLTKGRYHPERGLVDADIGEIDPQDRMNAPTDPLFPTWLGVVTDVSGHSVWFIDPDDEREDPPIYHWDDEAGLPSPWPDGDSLAELLTWLIVNQSLRPKARESGDDVLGRLQPDLRFAIPSCSSVEEYLEGVKWTSWTVRDAEFDRSADGQLYRVGGLVVAKTAEAIEPLEIRQAAVDAKAAAEQKAEEHRRREETTRQLERSGSPTDPETQLAALEAVADRLTRLEAIFLSDFRMRVRAGSVLDGLRKRAAELITKYPAD